MEPYEIYHVFNRANGEDLLFRDRDDYRRFKYYVFKYLLLSNQFELYAYCLMPNHFHLMISPLSIEHIKDENYLIFSKIFSNMFNAYAKFINYKYKRKGSLFMRPFKRKQIKSSLAFGKLIHYIHANPVHHGYCKDVRQWPHSSYSEFIGESKLINKKSTALDWFGSVDIFEAYHAGPIGRKVNGLYVE